MLAPGASSGVGAACRPTPADSLGPFYEPGAPVRAKVGSGYLLTGRVLSAPRCRPIARARIELWLANAEGIYDDAHRATIYTNRFGRYRFQSSKPPSYGGRPPHIHLRVTAAGHRTLVTQHYPKPAANRAVFELVLARR